MRVTAAPRDGFRGTFVAHPLGETVTLTQARTGPLRTARTARMAALSDAGDLLFFYFHLAGSGRLRHNPSLTVAALAHRHHISIRRTHLLFGRIGMTPGAYIGEQRMLAAKALLADPRFSGGRSPRSRWRSAFSS